MRQLDDHPDDTVSDLLGQLRVRSSVYCLAELRSPWGFRIVGRNVAKFHLMLDGHGWLVLDGREPLRVSAGDLGPGAALLEFVEPLIYRSTLDFRAVEAVSETRQRISEKMASRRANSKLDVKLTPGGIRDIEFLVQCLQRLHGGREPWVRHGGTLFALFRLRDKGLLSGQEYARLAAGYQFFRHLEHRLAAIDVQSLVDRAVQLGLARLTGRV